ncbi:hypothetical protein CNMCM8980_002375 [Aspergillus fumigatiaffinis]|nr:hypothetical protein CNMCM8980_002375 [Aspergillus fumigatiaffinis]
MSFQGQLPFTWRISGVLTDAGGLWNQEHGLHITAIEAGTGSVTRQQRGGPTRFSFKKPFKHLPHVQLTMDCGENPTAPFKDTFIFLLGDNRPAVDREGFSVGIVAPVGFTATFRYMAIGISESTPKSAPTHTKTTPTKSTTKKEAPSKPLKAPADGDEEDEEEEE